MAAERYLLRCRRLHPAQQEYAIYLVDVFDNVTELCRLEGYSLLEPIPLQPRPTPPVIPDRVQPGADEASIFLLDVYRGPQMQGVPRGTVKSLRLFTYNYVYRDAGNRGFGHLATPGVDGPWEPRYLLGTVPVREDGSALFRLPANVPVSVQPLDAQGRALQVMRGWYTAMPGRVSQVGCHEPMSQAPAGTPTARANSERAHRPWRAARGFDFELRCSRYSTATALAAMMGRPGDRISRKTESKLRINEWYHSATQSTITTTLTSFIALHPYGVGRLPSCCNQSAVMLGRHQPAVQLLRRATTGEPDAEAWDRLYTWIDLAAPGQGSWKRSEWGVPGNYYDGTRLLAQFGGRKDDVGGCPARTGPHIRPARTHADMAPPRPTVPGPSRPMRPCAGSSPWGSSHA